MNKMDDPILATQPEIEFLNWCIVALGGAPPAGEIPLDQMRMFLQYEIERVNAQLVDKPMPTPPDVQHLHSEVAMLRGQLERSNALAHKLLDFLLNSP